MQVALLPYCKYLQYIQQCPIPEHPANVTISAIMLNIPQ
jgi:hypothetical protein